mmetsp:Transcript_116666/g.308212  ORF Transcript_116666/g.308212 Transcript_116666/m.308212 type:complete len:208 (+) Transcript_116666:294-917(+)
MPPCTAGEAVELFISRPSSDGSEHASASLEVRGGRPFCTLPQLLLATVIRKSRGAPPTSQIPHSLCGYATTAQTHRAPKLFRTTEAFKKRCSVAGRCPRGHARCSACSVHASLPLTSSGLPRSPSLLSRPARCTVTSAGRRRARSSLRRGSGVFWPRAVVQRDRAADGGELPWAPHAPEADPWVVRLAARLEPPVPVVTPVAGGLQL